MYRSPPERRRIALPALVVVGLSLGCAGWDGVLALTPPDAPEPEDGLEMRIGRVLDERVFQNASPDPWQPTLRDGSPEQRALTSHVVGRRRRRLGPQTGNLFLPTGQSVESLVGSAISAGYERAGYRVLAPEDPGYEEALAIDAQIQQLWGRPKPSLGPPMVEFRIRVRLRALPDFERGATISCASEISAAKISPALYARTIELGLDRFAWAVRARLLGEAPVERCEPSG